MNIMGSIPVFLYLGIRRLLKEQISAEKYCWLLLLSMVFYIVPFPVLSRKLRFMLYTITKRQEMLGTKVQSMCSGKVYRLVDDTLYLPRYCWLFYLAIGVWFVVFCIAFCRTIFSYRFLRDEIQKTSRYEQTISIPFLFWQRRVEIRLCYEGNSAFSTGLFHPVIVMSEYTPEEIRRYLLLHEIAHIQHMDFLVRYLTKLACSLCWFNPLVYILMNQLKTQQEFVADRCVMEQLTCEEQKYYGSIIYRTAVDTKRESSLYCVSSFSDSSYEVTKERLIRIKNIMKKKNTKSAAIILAMLICVLGNVIPVLAYQTPFVLIAQSAEEESLYFTRGSWQDDITDFSISDYVFIDEKGNCFPVLPEQIIENEYARACSHQWVSGSYQTHIKHSDRSCDVVTYSAKQCAKCGVVTYGDPISTTHYNKCPH
ncbi:MAG: M56 family metallopeptidase [Eubacteriales bacterium]|nr:M56 family metallopeptidase [Eubacteriales bacterium]